MIKISNKQARQIWLTSQKLTEVEPWGQGPEATHLAIQHLGYVQIDTINVIERCHHHILWNRIPKYKKQDLQYNQSVSKTIFEAWTHALSYVSTEEFNFYIRRMKEFEKNPGSWFNVDPSEVQRVLKILKSGALTIRDVKDDRLVEKDHEWASRKPSKKILQYLFYSGKVTISERQGMLKKYELTERHFNWKKQPKAATESEILDYRLDRALRSQGIVSLDSIDHLRPSLKLKYKVHIEMQMKKNSLIEVQIKDLEKISFWVKPENLSLKKTKPLIHILSPFDPLIIQRKRLKNIFDYEHRFEAYLPIEKRIFGYFTLPVLFGDQIVAMLDLKTDRAQKKLLIQKWHWVLGCESNDLKSKIESHLEKFEKFQLS